jgi:SAM-dependent methyltransferase
MPASAESSEKQTFLAAMQASLDQETFVRLTLSGYGGEEVGLNSLLVQLVKLKAGLKLSFTYRYQTKEIVKNWLIAEGIEQVAALIGDVFANARLFTSEKDLQINYNKRQQPRLVTAKSTFPGAVLSQNHDRVKHRYIETANNVYLNALGVTNAQGEIIKTREAKYRQINKFIEIVDSLYRASELPQKSSIKAVDLGSGKGYLTFALYDFFSRQLSQPATVIGIEARPELVATCNAIAAKAEFTQLQFEAGTIAKLAHPSVDIAIALHACDTATDDVIFTSVQAQASLIILAPCCHKQIRRELNNSPDVQSMWEFGTLIERQAQLVTDRLRSLFLELHGYKTKVFEFIDAEHTDKNIMITATRTGKSVNKTAILQQIETLKQHYGIRWYYLEDLFQALQYINPRLGDLT